MFFIAKTYKYSNIFKDVSTALDMTMVALDMTMVALDMIMVTLDMTMLSGADPYERHTYKDERQIDGLGTQVPFLEDEGGACE